MSALRTNLLTWSCAALLAACGGGGGGGDSSNGTAAPGSAAPLTASNTPDPVCNDAPLPPTGSTVVISGIATFTSVPYSTSSGALLYSGASNKPARAITVQAVSGCTVVASAVTNEQGAYSLTVPSNTNVFVRMRAQMLNTTGSAKWNVAVRDNTAGEALWVVDGTASSSGSTNSTRAINAASGWNGVSYTSFRGAAPFAILDTVYSGIQRITGVQSNAQFPPLTMYWSPNNTTAQGNTAIGEIGTSFFTAFFSGNTIERAIYILGKQDNDTDEYDSPIVAHEFGHYVQSAFSTNQSMGGQHSPLDKLDMTLAFSEGWGYGWAGMVLNNPINTDSFGPRQGNGVTSNLSRAPADAQVGWYREDSIETVLYQFFTSQGFAPIWAALTGPMKNSQDALATIFSFASAVRDAGNAAVSSALNALLSAQNIFTGTGANQWGAGETNNGGSASNLPIYTTLSLNTPTPVCFINANVKAEDKAPNKLGTWRYFRINLPSAGNRTITASFPQGRDLDFDVLQNREILAIADSTVATSETATLPLAAGEVIIRVSDYVTNSPLTAPNCATLTIN